MFYQGYLGDIYEIQIDVSGSRGVGTRVPTILQTQYYPTITSTAPRFGTSLATVVVGQNRDQTFLSYQAQDNVSCVIALWRVPSH